MKFIDPKVEWWKEFSSERHIARVSRICYKAKSQAANHALTPMQQVEEENNQAKRIYQRVFEKFLYSSNSIRCFEKCQRK